MKNTIKKTFKTTLKSTLKNTPKNALRNTLKNTPKNTLKNRLKNTPKNTLNITPLEITPFRQYLHFSVNETLCRFCKAVT